MKNILITILLVFACITLSAQTRLSSDNVSVKRGAASDTIQDTDQLTDTYYADDFSEYIAVYHELDTVVHDVNDTLEVALQVSYNNSDWIEVDRDTVTVTSAHTVLQTYTGKVPYFRTWCRGLSDYTQATQTKWKYNLLIDVNE